MPKLSDGSIVPPWTYRPGPDVSPAPPLGLVAAQEIARHAAQAGCAAAVVGATEIDILHAVSRALDAQGVKDVWTITNVGVGANAHTCFPTQGPSDLALTETDLAMIDVHPITADGFWSDCTRCAVVGDNKAAQSGLDDLTAIYREVMSVARPGVPACELFGTMNSKMVSEGFVLLDTLANIGHSLSAGSAYLNEFIDANNATPMWGAWAVEPFAARDGAAVKVEDLFWFGREDCILI
ncbi:M24 family metallopeptidase [Roseibium sp.]|uniref:M24 family metallopeptidase n=1 Tax=Roseibium sp. TaxID=1936156 RepID=UPI003A979BC3